MSAAVRQRQHRLLDALRTSLWFVPALLVTGAVTLALLLMALDARLGPPEHPAWRVLLVASEEAARATLSTIAASIMTVAGVVFSITIVVMTLASSQYSPRVIRTFMRDRLSQVALGVFVGVFAYCLLVLAAVGGGSGGNFVPTRAIAVGIVSAVVGMAVLVLYIHHVARAIQPVHILAAAASETMAAVDELFPEGRGEEPPPTLSAPEQPPTATTAHARRSGYIQRVDLDALLDHAVRHGLVLQMHCPVGAFVFEGAPLVSAWRPAAASGDTDAAGAGLAADLDDTVATALVVARFQTEEQDVGYGLRQIVDVALRALSPALNDEATAMQAIDYIGAVMARLAARPMPSLLRCSEKQLRVVAKAPSFEQLLGLGFRQVVRVGASSPEVLLRVLATLQAVLASTTDDRADSVRQFAGLVATASMAIADEESADAVRRLAHSVQGIKQVRAHRRARSPSAQ